MSTAPPPARRERQLVKKKFLCYNSSVMPPKKRPPAKKIYVVEDDPIILDYLETVLKSLKYKVSSSQSGEGALEGIARNGSDLVLLDVMLPDVDGITLCRHLRQDRRTRDIPVIMLTCLTDSSTISNAYAHGAV